ncbi:conserved hypothetical protein [Burkholderiales bacterium 8X]|nr:conserved hypothetical protein [Burkholderiales bacterium 8X]
MTLPVLLVEDDAQARVFIADLLHRSGRLQVVAMLVNQIDAIAALRSPSQPWSIVVIDLLLEQGSGLSVLAACRKRRPDQHAVVLTNYATAAMRRRCLDAGADAVYDKSEGLDELLEQCQRWSAAKPVATTVVRQLRRS